MNIRYQIRNMGFFLKCASQCKRKSRIFYNSCWAMGIFGTSKKVSYKYDMFKIDTFCVTLRTIDATSKIFLSAEILWPISTKFICESCVLYAQVIVICVGLQKIWYSYVLLYWLLLCCVLLLRYILLYLLLLYLYYCVLSSAYRKHHWSSSQFCHLVSLFSW